MNLRLLGTVEVVDDDGVLVPIGAPMLRATLAALALRAGHVVPVGELMDQLWGGRPPATAGATLRNYIKRLRKVIPKDRIRTESGGYRLDVEPADVDVLRFRELRARARALAGSDPQAAARTLDAALALWRGTPFTDLGDGPLRSLEQPRLEDLYLATVEERFAIGLDLGEHHVLVDEIMVMSQVYYLRERLLHQLIVALYRCGRTAEALAAYRSARKRLVAELGIEPGMHLRKLEQAILRSDPELAGERSGWAGVPSRAPLQRAG
ncbi:AfsR/SARP family transcriptional regulator [Streptomyces cinnamoneus]|uniref:AfsR/SARP family transcriptional regulator n=1 Tax=Streptomyces cinnamoneus TaxID=53446 RepID=UPI0037B8E48D